eukprot:SAG31_NODE_581_length_13927_cov_78.549899_6_plen_74_part_00
MLQDPNREDDKLGFTPLHYAVRAGADYLVATLVKNGADADRPDKFGATALQGGQWTQCFNLTLRHEPRSKFLI